MKTHLLDNAYLTDLLTDVQQYLEVNQSQFQVLSIVISQYKARYFATITLRP